MGQEKAYQELADDAFVRMLKCWQEVDDQDVVLRRMKEHKLWSEYWRLEIELLVLGNALELAKFALRCDRAAWLFCKIVREASLEPELDLFTLS